MERNNRNRHIQTLPQKMLFFGGVYSNLQALEALKSIADEQKVSPSNIICTGDMVGYCAQPEETVQFIKNWGIQCIAGNVELQLASGETDCGCDFDSGSRCDIFSKQWYPYAQQHLSSDSMNWIKKLPEFITFQYAGKSFLVVHGSFDKTAEYIFKSTPWQRKEENFNDTGADVIIAGHCGLPFQDQNEKYRWFNPGVIGMPANDGNTKVWYGDLTMGEELTFNHHQFSYNNQLTASKMSENKLPEAYRKTLLSGIWDNCEILPEVETALQGRPIVI